MRYRFSDHAIENIEERTEATTSNILRALSQKWSIPLGSADRYEYMLLYEPEADTYLIAVIVSGTRLVHSVWKHRYRVPSSVKAATRKRRQHVRDRYYDDVCYQLAPQ